MPVDAIVLGGGKIRNSGEPKAFFTLRGKMMLEYVLEALCGAQSLQQIVLVVPRKEDLEKVRQYQVKVVVSDGSILDNLGAGLKLLPNSKFVLVSSSDIPFINSAMVDEFIKSCFVHQADGYYPIVPKERVETKFPQTKRTYATLREGAFTGGNFILVKPAVFLENWSRLEDFFASRKSPFKLAQLLGPVFIFKFLLRRLTIAEAEKKMSALFNATLKAIIVPFPEVGTDIDKEEDLALVKEL